MKPLVSIVIPAYNHADYLKSAIDSVLSQDYDNLELIVINDGSTDHTADVISQYEGRLVGVSQTNAGQSKTLQRGWEMAKGEVLSYLSADDLLLPGAVSASVSVLFEDQELVACYPDFQLIDPSDGIIRTVSLEDYSYDLMLSQVSCPVGPGAFFKADVYRQIESWNSCYRQMPDYDFWLRLGLLGPFKHIASPLAGFRVHEGSQTFSQTTEDRANEPVKIIQSLRANPLAQDLSSTLLDQALCSAYLVSAQLHVRAGRFSQALTAIRQSGQISSKQFREIRFYRILLNAFFNRLGHKILWRLRSLLNR